MSQHEPKQSLAIGAAGDAWAAAQRARRKPLAERTIESYRDAWRSFTGWAEREGKRSVSQIGVTDLARWADGLARKTDGTVLTYSHGVLLSLRWRLH